MSDYYQRAIDECQDAKESAQCAMGYVVSLGEEIDRLRAELEQVKSYNEALTQRAVEDAEIDRLKAEIQADNNTIEDMNHQITGFKEKIVELQAKPNQWIAVPPEPTEHQRNAAYGIIASPIVKDKKALVDGIYKAMLKAAEGE